LDESILLLFDEREMAALKDLYREEIAHFKCVSVEQFLDVLREVGERCSKGWITQLFRGYAGSEKELRSWKHFMEVMAHIKRYRTSGGVVVQNPLEKLMSFFRRKKIGALLQPKTEKMGDWCAFLQFMAIAR
jgi:Ca2+-binding EF-hand superfamily protein